MDVDTVYPVLMDTLDVAALVTLPYCTTLVVPVEDEHEEGRE